MSTDSAICFNQSISELPDLDANITHAYGVVVDEYTSDTNPNLREISILAACDEDDQDNLSLDVIDCILSYTTYGASVILEVGPDLDLEPSSLVVMAGSTRFDLSILPPESLKNELTESNKADADQYVERLIAFCDPWLNTPSSVTSIHPFNGYFAYLIGQQLGHKPEKVTTDSYMDYRFVQSFSESAMDYIKDRLTAYIYNFMGGEEGLSKYAHTLAAAIYKQVEDIAGKIEGSAKEASESEDS